MALLAQKRASHLLDHHLQRVLDALRADAAVPEPLEGEMVRAARRRAVDLRSGQVAVSPRLVTKQLAC